jgi:chromosome segregation ATPase
VAVIGASLPGEGVTFVELPAFMGGRHEPTGPGRRANASAASSGEAEELAALRLQLAEAQRRGDLQAIERQSLLERLEQAEDRIASLDEELESRQDGGGASSSDHGTSDGPRIDELLTREQSLRWELDRVQGELEHLRVRPVDELEAELASMQAQLEQAEAALAEVEADADADAHPGADELIEATAQALDESPPTPAQAREWMKARTKLDHLLRKLERGGELSALQLHRELSALRRLL